MTSLTVPLAVCPWSPVAMQIYSPESISFFADLEEYIKFVFVFVFLIVFVFVFVFVFLFVFVKAPDQQLSIGRNFVFV